MAVEYKIIGGDGHEYGPASLEEIRQWCEDGRVAPGTPVWRDDERRWLPAGNRAELQWDLPKPPEPPPVLVPEPPRSRPAGFLVRMAAYLFDRLILLCLISFVTLPWNGKLSEMQTAAQAEMKRVSAAGPQEPEKVNWEVLRRFVLVMSAIEVPITFTYFILFNTLRGATPGKRLFGLRIVRLDGSDISLGQAIGRQFGYWLSFLPVGMGFLMIAMTPERRALHDLVARTQVVFQR